MVPSGGKNKLTPTVVQTSPSENNVAASNDSRGILPTQFDDPQQVPSHCDLIISGCPAPNPDTPEKTRAAWVAREAPHIRRNKASPGSHRQDLVILVHLHPFGNLYLVSFSAPLALAKSHPLALTRSQLSSCHLHPFGRRGRKQTCLDIPSSTQEDFEGLSRLCPPELWYKRRTLLGTD